MCDGDVQSNPLDVLSPLRRLKPSAFYGQVIIHLGRSEALMTYCSLFLGALFPKPCISTLSTMMLSCTFRRYSFRKAEKFLQHRRQLVDLRAPLRVQPKLDNAGVDREADPERDTKNLIWMKICERPHSKEHTHHRPGGCDSQENAYRAGHPNPLFLGKISLGR